MKNLVSLRAGIQVACCEYVKAAGNVGNEDDIALRMMQAACREYDHQRRGELLAEACSALNGFRSLFDEHDPEANRILASCEQHLPK